MPNLRRLPYAVLTGDLVESQAYPPSAISAALDVIRTIAEDHVGSSFDIAPKFTRFRGDGWQFVMGNAPQSLQLAVRIFASLKGAADLPTTRLSIGIGQIDSLGADTLADAAGEAFIASGRALDWLERKGGTFAISGPGVTALHQIAAEFLELRLQLWTQPQAEATALFLRPTRNSGRDIAVRLGISQQAVSYRLTGADARRIAELLYEWETEFKLMPGDADA